MASLDTDYTPAIAWELFLQTTFPGGIGGIGGGGGVESGALVNENGIPFVNENGLQVIGF